MRVLTAKANGVAAIGTPTCSTASSAGSAPGLPTDVLPLLPAVAPAEECRAKSVDDDADVAPFSVGATVQAPLQSRLPCENVPGLLYHSSNPAACRSFNPWHYQQPNSAPCSSSPPIRLRMSTTRAV